MIVRIKIFTSKNNSQYILVAMFSQTVLDGNLHKFKAYPQHPCAKLTICMKYFVWNFCRKSVLLREFGRKTDFQIWTALWSSKSKTRGLTLKSQRRGADWDLISKFYQCADQRSPNLKYYIQRVCPVIFRSPAIAFSPLIIGGLSVEFRFSFFGMHLVHSYLVHIFGPRTFH